MHADNKYPDKPAVCTTTVIDFSVLANMFYWKSNCFTLMSSSESFSAHDKTSKFSWGGWVWKRCCVSYVTGVSN